jgi:phosphoenolpyruvate carboxylase
MVNDKLKNYVVINPLPKHFLEIQNLCRRVYPFSKPWTIDQLESHRFHFPDGQLIVVDTTSNKVVGLAFSLIVDWSEYTPQDNWIDFTSAGFFHNHNPKKGKTLYGAEVMVDPDVRGKGIGKMLYEGRRQIVEKYGLKRIRAGARLRGYSKFQNQLAPDEYVRKVVAKEIYDPTLSFQLGQGFKVIDVAAGYLMNDPESLGYAAVIEWLNPKTNDDKDFKRQEQSVQIFLSGSRFVPQLIPRELRRLVRIATLELGKAILDSEGKRFYGRVEYYREQLKRVRRSKNKDLLNQLLQELQKESPDARYKLAHAFSLQLEIVNVCEAAYRTWRLRQKQMPLGNKNKLRLTYVLTAHPTEARNRVVVDTLSQLGDILLEGINTSLTMYDRQITSLMGKLWLLPLTKPEKPTVSDEAEYIYSMLFSDKIFWFFLSEKPGYELRVRTWVGGDKDGHPGVDEVVMKDSLRRSRGYILQKLDRCFRLLLEDLCTLAKSGVDIKSEQKQLDSLRQDLKVHAYIQRGDGSRLKAWQIKYKKLIAGAHRFVQNHEQVFFISRVIELFPAFVVPLELREDAELIAHGLHDKSSVIRRMLAELDHISGALPITLYAQGLVISHCETAEDISRARALVHLASRNRTLPIIPLFETQSALLNAKKTVKEWLSQRQNLDQVQRYWGGMFEVMLGYSDSAKEVGVLPSRYLIAAAMADLEKKIKSYGLKPVFFHGSGGSIARGGGSLKEQISWWSNSAVGLPKVTIQGEMIQRTFASKEILDSQSVHLTNEAMKRGRKKPKPVRSSELDRLASIVQAEYRKLVDDQSTLNVMLEASPYRYLNKLKIGSRPSKRPSDNVTTAMLRAIPWVLCWTQTRSLFPTWWGMGAAWRELGQEEKQALQKLYGESPFFSSFVKALGFTLAKVELEVWELYYKQNGAQDLFRRFRREYEGAKDFVQYITQEKQMIWYRPWLEESIKLRAPHIHILNLLQIVAMQSDDEALLRETIVGIACGMLTTG